MSDGERARGRRRPMRRVGEILPATAASLGLEGELRMARAIATWERIVAEHVPGAAGGTRLVGVSEAALLVSATAPIVAQEVRLHADALLRAFAAAVGERRAGEIRIVGPGRLSGAGAAGSPPPRLPRDPRVD